jgi:hypothetical protein
MNFICNTVPSQVSVYISKGWVIGRPRPEGGKSVSELERDGLVGVYDPSDSMDLNKTLRCSGSIVLNLGPNPFDNMEVEPESTLDDRIKETQRDLKNPAKYRARWTGTKYVYESIDS